MAATRDQAIWVDSETAPDTANRASMSRGRSAGSWTTWVLGAVAAGGGAGAGAAPTAAAGRRRSSVAMIAPRVRLVRPATRAVRESPSAGRKAKPPRAVPTTAPAVFTA